ncbi:MAG TPA: insulinase family protein, partial [Actinomycetales bacterium]|nr:insulinase family protein [Actinomycetales bacterium]
MTKTNVPTQLPLVPSGSAGSELSLEQDGGALVRRTILPGGVRVITERIPGMRSAALGAWVPVGSRDEVAGARGSSHYLEHLLFKGTRRRTARDIARAFDAAGGEANAATSKESTCYFARVLDKDLPMAIDVIGDMITSPALDLEEFE